MSELDNIARINVPDAMVYIKTPEVVAALIDSESVIEHGAKTVTYVPDGSLVAVMPIDPEDMEEKTDTEEQKKLKSISRYSKLAAQIEKKKFVKLEDYKNVVAPKEIPK